MFLPLVQDVYPLWQAKPLNGSYDKPVKPRLTLDNWLSRGFQDSTDRYVRLGGGFGPAFIRLGNQLQFSLFKKALANGVVVGKNNYLYEENYIHAYYGEDYIGLDSINKNLDKLKFLQDTLHRLGHELIVILCPGKASFYPEYIPDQMRKAETRQTNMLGYVRGLPVHHIHHIDFYTWFLRQKYKSIYPLYPQYGIHWSNYAEYLVADSIARYIGQLAHRRMPEMKITRVETSRILKGRDNDIADGLNLLDSLGTYPMAYPSIEVLDTIAHKPSGLMIADSYYWGAFGTGLQGLYFGDNDFWYYNEESYNNKGGSQKVGDLNLLKEIERHEIVAIMFTEVNANRAGWGFIENACRVFHYKESPKHN